MLFKAIKYLAIFAVAFFPFALWKSLAFPLVFSHIVFIFTVIEILFLLFLVHSFEKEEIVVRKSYITASLLVYLLILFITALVGTDFGYSFWSSYTRFSGIVTWLHYFAFFLVLSSVFSGPKDWKNLFRALAASGFALAIFSLLGRDGFALQSLAFLNQGGSFLGNTSYSGAYMLLIFFFSIVGLLMEENKKWKIVYVISMLSILFNPDLFNFGVFNGSVSLVEGLKNPITLVGVARTSSLVLWAGLLLALGLYFLDKLKDKRRVVVWAFTGLVLLFAVYVFGFMSLMSGEGKLHDFYVKNSGPMRPMVWQMAVEGIKDRPLLGWGDGNFKYVYQNNLDVRMVHLENPPWFDRSHNFTLEEFIGHGILGASVMLGMFILIVVTSFKLYLREGKLYFLLIPFIFFLHFLQLQTFFQVDSTLFLTLIFLAFLVSHEGHSSVKIPKPEYVITYQVAALAVVLAAFFFFVVDPIRENRLIPLIKNTKARSERLSYQKKLSDISIDPMESLRQVTLKFMDETILHAKDLQQAGFVKNVGDEYRSYLAIYDKYLPKYSEMHRYLFEYANFINSAFVFGVDELVKGEELARKSLSISRAYPYPYWVLAVNLHYQGRTVEALAVAKEGYELDPTIATSKQVYDTLQERVKFKSSKQSFFYLPIN